MLDEFVRKSTAASAGTLTKVANAAAASPQQEKTRKDMFKRLVQPIVGKSLGELYKQEIKIRVLEPLLLNTKRRMNAAALALAGEGGVWGKNGNEVNICSLFDPTNV